MSDFDQDPWATDTPAADPWAAGPPADEAQTSAPTSTAPTVAPSKESTTVVNSTENKTGITTTIKYGAGFDAPWTVIHSNTVEEAKATLNEAKDLLELTAKVAKYAKSLDSGTAPAGNRGGGQSQPSSPPPGQPSKSCAHGDMTYRTGNGAKGPWKGYFCPLEKGNPEQCKPIFVK